MNKYSIKFCILVPIQLFSKGPLMYISLGGFSASDSPCYTTCINPMFWNIAIIPLSRFSFFVRYAMIGSYREPDGKIMKRKENSYGSHSQCPKLRNL